MNDVKHIHDPGNCKMINFVYEENSFSRTDGRHLRINQMVSSCWSRKWQVQICHSKNVLVTHVKTEMSHVLNVCREIVAFACYWRWFWNEPSRSGWLQLNEACGDQEATMSKLCLWSTLGWCHCWRHSSRNGHVALVPIPYIIKQFFFVKILNRKW